MRYKIQVHSLKVPSIDLDDKVFPWDNCTNVIFDFRKCEKKPMDFFDDFAEWFYDFGKWVKSYCGENVRFKNMDMKTLAMLNFANEKYLKSISEVSEDAPKGK